MYNDDFVKVDKNRFILNGEVYRFCGANFWYAMNLASCGPGGHRQRLMRELDTLNSMGITNLRILAGSEGPDSEPWRVTPAVQPEPGVYNDDLLDGLDFLLAEMGGRGMKAVLYLANFWEWSGGLSQYLAWHGAGPVPYPGNGNSWRSFQKYTARFYSHEKAMECLDDHIRFIISRKNSYTGSLYTDDPAIMSWQLCNEPRGVNNRRNFNRWIARTARLIKSLDRNHLVSTGTEGETPFAASGLDFRKNNSSPDIDYMTFHLWVQNWNKYIPSEHGQTYGPALKFAAKYIEEHAEKARELGKPVVLEEFGFPRDCGSHDPGSGTVYRDEFYETVYNMIYGGGSAGSPPAGSNFWAWSGYSRPPEPGGLFWKPGDELTGDPPHERQGWYGVYSNDSTCGVIRKFSGKFSPV